MDNGTRPHTAGHGARIGMDQVPDQVWTGTVLDVEPCETDTNRPAEHARYQVRDLEGQLDWLCAYDVRPVSG